jgi:hypothetical protein
MLIHETKILHRNTARQRTLQLTNTRPAADQNRMPAALNPLRSHWVLVDGKLRLAWSLDDKPNAGVKPGPRRKSSLRRPARSQGRVNVSLTGIWESGTFDAWGPEYCFMQTGNFFEKCAA